MRYIKGHLDKHLKEWQGKEWYHQRFDGSPYFIHFIAEAEIVTHLKRKKGAEFSAHYCFFQDDKADWYIAMSDIKNVYTSIIEGGSIDKHYTKKLMALWKPDEKKFEPICKYISKLNLSKFTDKKIIALHDKFVETTLNRNSSSSLIDGFALGTDQIIADKLKTVYESLEIKNGMRFSEFFSTLTAPVHLSFINEAELALLKVAKSAKRNPAQKNKLLSKHQKQYFWIRNNYVDAHILSVEHFNNELDALIKNHSDIDEEMKKIKTTPTRNKKAKKDLMKKVKLSPDPLYLIETTELFTRWQDERKKATFFAIHFGALLLGEIGKRVGISTHELKYMSPREVSAVFKTKPDQKILKDRIKLCAFYWDKYGHEACFGKKAEEVKKTILGVGDLSAIKDFRGLTACIGKATGKVKVVKSVKDAGKVNEGDILVAVMTRPDYIPAMKLASAFVTDEGGITCHAAIVARELKKPCIIGTKIATKVLKDNDNVMVNADHSVVQILN